MSKLLVSRVVVAAAAMAAILGGVGAAGAAASSAPSQPKPDGRAAASAVSALNRADPVCSRYADGSGDLCLWYLSNRTGSMSAFYNADRRLQDDVFLSAGAGRGQVVANNAEYACNRDRYLTAVLYTGRHQTGQSTTVAPGQCRNLSGDFSNNVESFAWR